MAISGPIRCLSSHMTSALLTFRNPQGTDESWLTQEERINNYMIHTGKVILTEMAASLLIVTSFAEFATYGSIMVISSPLLLGQLLLRLCFTRTSLISDYISKPLWNLCASASFTTYWNISNITFFNLFYTNVITHESLARFSNDYLRRGLTYRIFVQITVLVLGILYVTSICMGCILPIPFRFTPISTLMNSPATRASDRLYLHNWARNHRIALPNMPEPNQLLTGLMAQYERTTAAEDAGAEFFKTYVLADEVDEGTRNKILEMDYEVIPFALTRAVYVYTFGNKKSAELPPFFKAETCQLIEELRSNYSQAQSSFLRAKLQSLTSFEEGITHDNATIRQERNTLFTKLKAAAVSELQDSIFLTNCWQKGSQEYQASRAVAQTAS